MTDQQRLEKLGEVMHVDVALDNAAVINMLIERDICPDCGSMLIHEGACNTCYGCGWSTCW